MSGQKLSKEHVNYRKASSTSKDCGNCDMYKSRSGTCTLVKGPISPNMVCNQWESK